MKIVNEINDISDSTKAIVRKELNKLKYIKPNDFNEISFSDVTFTNFPVFDKNNNFCTGYLPVFANGEKNISQAEHMERFMKLNIDTLPLIDVAKLLDIKVEKSNNIKPYGTYIHKERKIVLGSDYIVTFIHELVHAIVHFGKENDLFYLYDSEYDEIIAEFAAVTLCKIYNIKIDLPYSIYYMNMYNNDIENSIPDHVIKTVEVICEFVKKCKEIINKRKNNK